MDARDLHMEDTPACAYAQPMLQSPIQDCGRMGYPESPTVSMDLDSDDEESVVTSPPHPKCGCLILCCVQCSSVVLVEYSNGTIPGRPRLSDTSPRCNGVALTTCPTCSARTKKGLEGRAHDHRGQFRMAQAMPLRPDLWDTSDLTKAAALVFEEAVTLMLAGRVCLHMSWSRVSGATTARDRVSSLDVSQAATGDARKIILSHLAGNWV